jgi:hypothetical protein
MLEDCTDLYRNVTSQGGVPFAPGDAERKLWTAVVLREYTLLLREEKRDCHFQASEFSPHIHPRRYLF